MAEKVKTAESERQDILALVAQLKGLHEDNREVVVVLDFLVDLIENRSEK